jgi:hypothetical protein
MAKYHPIINKSKGNKMGIWEKIKCFFGSCTEEIAKEQMTEAMNTYKAEPKVIKAPVKQAEKTPVEVILTKEVKKRLKAETKKVQEFEDKECFVVDVVDTSKITETGNIKKDTKPTKAKRHWYNNSKTQKLVVEGEETKLPKTWKKGQLKKKDK